jgi:hypothetical protein
MTYFAISTSATVTVFHPSFSSLLHFWQYVCISEVNPPATLATGYFIWGIRNFGGGGGATYIPERSPTQVLTWYNTASPSMLWVEWVMGRSPWVEGEFWWLQEGRSMKKCITWKGEWPKQGWWVDWGLSWGGRGRIPLMVLFVASCSWSARVCLWHPLCCLTIWMICWAGSHLHS